MNILLIAYYYPPINSGGTERPLKMAKYLNQFGHKVTVLTHSYKKNEWNKPEEIRIYDISHNKNRSGIYKILWKGLRIWVEILNIFGKYASIYSLWKSAVLKQTKKIILKTKPDIIIASYPPVETFEIGIKISQEYKIPLIADFRDGLLFEPIEKKRILQYKCIQKKYENIENTIAQRASVILTVSPPITEYFKNRYNSKQVYTIFNGFDKFDSPQTKLIKLEKGKFHLIHTGSFSNSFVGRNIKPFFRAVQKLLKEYPDLQSKFRLHLFGDLNTEEISTFDKLIQKDIVIYHGMIDQKIVLAYQRMADALLLITAINRRSMVTAKLLEYLNTNRPIIALTSKTYAEEIIKQSGTGWVINPEDESGIYHVLSKLISDKEFSI